MTLPSHRINRATSRWYKPESMLTNKYVCERPEWCNKTASEIHHIVSSYRGSKKRNEEWYQLVALCIDHHIYIHNHNNFNNRTMLLESNKNKWLY